MGVANRIEKLQCDFLWGGLDKEFKYYLRWSIVCTLISEGRLTIRNLLRFDHALLGKWLWCYGLERKAWCTKYGSSWRDWCCRKPIEVYGVGLWKNIMSGWGKFSSHTRFEVGNGSKVRFWYDLWCGDMALEEAFPGLFGITCAKDAFVGISWKFLDVPRAAHDLEVDVSALFFRMLYLGRVRPEDEDKLWWVLSKRGYFVGKSFSSVMSSNDCFHFPWKSVWQTNVSLMVFCLVDSPMKDPYNGQYPEAAHYCGL